MVHREKVREFIRSELLQAGASVFGQKGFHQATLEEIAKKADVAVGTLYLYFKSKEEMYFGLFEQKATSFMDHLHSQLRTFSNPLEQLKAFVNGMLEYFEKESDFFSIYLYERTNLERVRQNGISKQMFNLATKPVTMLTEIIHDAQDASLITAQDPKYLAFLLNGMVNAMILQWCVGGKKGSLTDKADVILSTFMDGARRKQ